MTTENRQSASKAMKWVQQDKMSRNKTEQSSSDLPELTSNKSVLRKTMGPRKLTLQGVLEKTNRSLEEAKFLFRVVKDMPFFADFNKKQNFEESDQEMLINLCRNIKYERYGPTDVIFKESQPSDGKFYIVMKGIVYVVQSAEKTKSFFEEQNRQIRESANTKPSIIGSDNDSPHMTYSRRGSQVAESRRSSVHSGNSSRRSSLSNSNLPDKGSKNGTSKINSNAIPKLKVTFKTNRDAGEPTTPNRAVNKSKFKLTLDVNEAQALSENVYDLSLLQLKLNTSDPGVQNNGTDLTNPREENEQDQSPRNQSSNLQGKLKDTTGKLMKMIKLKGVFGQQGKKSQGVTLQERVAEYGVYRDKIEQGGSFGHAALEKGNVNRNATMIAATIVELLVIQKEDLQLIREHFYKTRMQMKEFLLKYFPHMDDVNASKTIESYLFLMREDIFNQGTIICQEGTSKDKIFIIFEGECELLKTFIVDKTINHRIPEDLDHHKRSAKIIQQTLPISILERGAFIGEETLFNQHERYEYTAKVISPRAVVYSIDRSVFVVRFPRMTFEGIRQNHLLRQANHIEVVNSILKTMFHSMKIVQYTETYEIGDETEERDLTQLKVSEDAFANPIIITPAYDPLNKKTAAKNLKINKDVDEKTLKSKILGYSHGFYTQNNDTCASGNKFFSKAADLKIIKESHNKLRLDLSDVQKTNVKEFKSKLQELQREEKRLKSEKSGSLSAREAKYQHNNRKLTLRNQDIERSDIGQYMKRALNNFCSEKSDDFLKPKNPSNIDEYRLGFGRQYELNRKKKGWESTRLAKTSKETSVKPINPGIVNIIGNFAKAKDKSLMTSPQKFDNPFNIERAKIQELQANNSLNSPKDGYRGLIQNKPQLQNIPLELKSSEDQQLQPNRSLLPNFERNNSSGFIFITSPRQDPKPSFQFEDNTRSFTLNADLSKRDSEKPKENKGDAVVQNLYRRYQTLKALSKHTQLSKNSTDKSSNLLETLTPRSLGTNHNQSDTLNTEILLAASNSLSYGGHSLLN